MKGYVKWPEAQIYDHEEIVMTQSLIQLLKTADVHIVNTFTPNKLKTTYSLELDPDVQFKH